MESRFIKNHSNEARRGMKKLITIVQGMRKEKVHVQRIPFRLRRFDREIKINSPKLARGQPKNKMFVKVALGGKGVGDLSSKGLQKPFAKYSVAEKENLISTLHDHAEPYSF